MCFEIDKNYEYPIIATKDILVVKLGDIYKTNFVSLTREHIYYEKVEQPLMELVIEEFDRGRGPCHTKVINKGYHSYCYRAFDPSENISQDYGLFKIPKGSKYYINSKNNEIVSNNIIYLRPLEISDLTKTKKFRSNIKIKKNKMMKNILNLTPTLASKLGSLIIHYQEYNSPNRNKVDLVEIGTLEIDKEVQTWLKECDKNCLLPKKRIKMMLQEKWYIRNMRGEWFTGTFLENPAIPIFSPEPYYQQGKNEFDSFLKVFQYVESHEEFLNHTVSIEKYYKVIEGDKPPYSSN